MYHIFCAVDDVGGDTFPFPEKKLHQHLISSTHRNLASSEHDFIINNVNDSVWLQIHNHKISLIHSGEAVSLDGANSSFSFTQTGKVSD